MKCLKFKLDKGGMHKVESCAVYFLISVNQIPKDRRDTTLEQFLKGAYYAGVTENKEVSNFS